MSDQTPQERLANVLISSELHSFPPFGATTPAVCFTESGFDDVDDLLGEGGFWEPWGVVVTRDWLWGKGGGPVWYVRDDVQQRVRPRLPPSDDVWLVRTIPGQSDWLHEREWRVPVPAGALPLKPGDLTAVLVGDPSWRPVVDEVGPSPPDFGDNRWAKRLPPCLVDVPRWFWDGTVLHKLDPFSDDVDCVMRF